jgi:ribonucleotide reductase beta subunit family protein with ferritin-like domain
MSLLPIETPNPLFGKYLYPSAKALMEQQQDIAWFAQEIKVENDIHDYLHNMSKDSYNLVTVTLTNFVEIEQSVGEIWDTISTWFPHSEIDGACKQIAAMEKSVHAFFYQKMSDTLNIDPEDTAKVQQDVAAIKNKLDYVKSITKNLSKNKLLSLAMVSMIEQVLLFSNFAMLKSFKANGHKLIPNTLTGVDYVVNDEVLHGVFAAYLHNTYIEEYKELHGYFNHDKHNKDLKELTESIVSYEDAIIDYTFQANLPINDITASQLKAFIRSRANLVLVDLGCEPLYQIVDNPIADWFYKGANSIKLHDFFSAGSNQYKRSWSLSAFSRKPYLEVK